MNFISWIQILNSLEIGLIFSLVALGVYLSFRVLDFPDLTVDGTFTLGAAVSATLIVNQLTDPWTSLLISFISGSIAGLVTAWLSTHLKILNLLAGILTMTALYSINLRIMGRPNIALMGEENIFNFDNIPAPAIIALLVLGIIIFLWWFLKTDLGLSVRATGANARMARANGIDDRKMILLGLGLSNGLVALAGAMFAQSYGFADITLSTGTIITGLAAVIIGEAVFLQPKRIGTALLACIMGSILYRLVIAFALDNATDWGFNSSDQNLVSALLVAIALLVPKLKGARK